MSAGVAAITATQNSFIGRNINNINDIPSPVANNIKSTVLNNPNFNMLFLAFAGIKYDSYI